MFQPLAPSFRDLLIGLLLAAALIIPWCIGRAVLKVWREVGRGVEA